MRRCAAYGATSAVLGVHQLHYPLSPEARLFELIADPLADLFGAKLSSATLAAPSGACAQRLKNVVETIRDHVVGAPVVNNLTKEDAEPRRIVNTPKVSHPQSLSSAIFRLGAGAHLPFAQAPPDRDLRRPDAVTAFVAFPKPEAGMSSTALERSPINPYHIHRL